MSLWQARKGLVNEHLTCNAATIPTDACIKHVCSPNLISVSDEALMGSCAIVACTSTVHAAIAMLTSSVTVEPAWRHVGSTAQRV